MTSKRKIDWECKTIELTIPQFRIVVENDKYVRPLVNYFSTFIDGVLNGVFDFDEIKEGTEELLSIFDKKLRLYKYREHAWYQEIEKALNNILKFIETE